MFNNKIEVNYMNNTVIKDNAIIFSRYGEVVRITACYNNSIRFEALPEGRITGISERI